MSEADGAATQLETLRGLVNAATQRLLGDTISVSDEDWQAPSRLPGWSRGHVASHIARQADGMVRLTEWARSGKRQDMYASAEQREADINAGAGRTGLEYQIDLDTSAGRLDQAFDALDDAAWQRAFELNLLSTVRLFRGVLPHMREQGWGRIVTVASSSIKQPIDNLVLSNTLRVGILGLAKSLALEVAGDGVLVNTIGPGRIATDRVASLDAAAAERTGRSVEDVRAASEAAIPIGRYGTPEEFAKVAAFLVSGANTYVTGQNFLVDGGMVRAI